MIRNHCWYGVRPASLARPSLLLDCSPVKSDRPATGKAVASRPWFFVSSRTILS
jgi:hypothetical protein